MFSASSAYHWNIQSLTSKGHPYEPLLAVSGIDHTIKIFSPDARAQEDARLGINGTLPRGSSGYSSISGRRRPARPSNPATEAPEGLTSRKRMQESYQITSQNDAERQGGMRDAFITVRSEGPFLRIRTREVDFREWISWFSGRG